MKNPGNSPSSHQKKKKKKRIPVGWQFVWPMLCAIFFFLLFLFLSVPLAKLDGYANTYFATLSIKTTLGQRLCVSVSHKVTAKAVSVLLHDQERETSCSPLTVSNKISTLHSLFVSSMYYV